MLRPALHLTVFMSAAVLLYVGVLHLRPYSYPDEFEMLLPDLTCDPPCVRGNSAGCDHRERSLHNTGRAPAGGAGARHADVERRYNGADVPTRETPPTVTSLVVLSLVGSTTFLQKSG